MLEEHKFPNDTINHFIYHPLNWQQVASGVVPHTNARSLLVRYQCRCSFQRDKILQTRRARSRQINQRELSSRC